MAKTLHSQHNKMFLSMLRGLREERHLRQSDLAGLVGRSQAMVSNVERGERRLDVIELREWLDALGVDFMTFLGCLDSELRRLGPSRIGALRPNDELPNLPALLNRIVAVGAGGK